MDQVETYLNELGEKGWEIIDLDVQMSPSVPGGPAQFLGIAKRLKA